MDVDVDLSVVISAYNEEPGIERCYTELTKTLSQMPLSYEIVFVNDGSIDNTALILRKIVAADNHIRLIDLSRNFGHEAAMMAGIDYSNGRAIICMDSDLQHPPVKIPEMVSKWEEGFEIVNMVRVERKDAGFVKKSNSKLFYMIINRMSDAKLAENASDFFLISRKVADVLKNDYRERTRFLRGIIQTIGFRKTTIEYVADNRIDGKSKYSFLKLLRLSFTAISSFTKLPLQLGLIAGVIFGCISLILIVYSIVMWIYNTPVSGYTTLIVFMSAFASIQLFVIGIIGQYVGYIFDEVKHRPIYIVRETLGRDAEK